MRIIVYTLVPPVREETDRQTDRQTGSYFYVSEGRRPSDFPYPEGRRPAPRTPTRPPARGHLSEIGVYSVFRTQPPI